MNKFLSILVLTLSTNVVMADAVEEMCSKIDKVCTCAANQLKSEVGENDYTLYENIGAAYIMNKTEGMSAGDAWNAAVIAEAKQRNSDFTKVLGQTNSIGRIHRKVINSCSK